MDVGDWIAAGSALVALGSAAVAARQARKANQAAGRSAEADTRAAEAAERANQLAETQAEAYVHGWEIVVEGGPGHWFLRNGSTEDAFDVTVADGDLGMMLIPGRLQDVVHPRGGFLLVGGYVFETEDPMITVTWHRRADRSDTARIWSRPLPAG